MSKSFNPNNKGKGNKPNYKPKNKGNKPETSKERELEPTSVDVNDSSFYYTDMALRDQICNFSFNEYLGRPIPYKNAFGWNMVENYPASLMCIQLNPSVAPTGDPDLGRAVGINLAGMKNFLAYSADNNKQTLYGPEDVTGLIMALGECLKMISHASRCFGLLNYFNKRDWTAPRQFFNAMDIDFDDFVANAADYRIKLNTLIAALDKMPIPSNIAYLNKCSNWFQTVYLDQNGPMAQCYMFVPYSTWVLDEAGTTQGSVLTTTYVAYSEFNSGDTWDGNFTRILTILEDQINALLTSSTMQYIFSDLLRKNNQGKQPIANVAGVPDGYTIAFAKSDEIALFIHNMVTVGPPVDQDWKHELYTHGNTGLNDVWLSAEHAGVIYNPEFYPAAWHNSKWGYWDNFAPGVGPQRYTSTGLLIIESLISDYFVEPSAEAKIAATRLSARGKVRMDTSDGVQFYMNNMAFCDAYVVHCYMYTTVGKAPEQVFTLNADTSSMGHLTDFNLFPICYYSYWMTDSAGVPTDCTYVREYGELNYWTMLDLEFMRRMYEAEMLGLFELR